VEERVWEGNKEPPDQGWHRDVRSLLERDHLGKTTKEYRYVCDLLEYLKPENVVCVYLLGRSA
jgi:hypothetical protein